ncbi:MAG TPA: hypothetical protein DEO84_03390 [candidate division Zixibacteria bacterium]|nr:hypothetical protein [candidate division Zixibacteria bacterium]HBZ00346.1 hypothetical protein [candidate division Zixibacteria bacterium]
MPFYNSENAAIYYEIEGQGIRPLVLLHGYALNGLMWELQRQAFSENYKLITIDLRGFGKSSCGKCWSGADMANDVKGVIETLGLADVAVLGFSMSGPVAVRLACEIPDIVTRLILVSSILPSSGRPKSPGETRLQERELAALEIGGIDAWLESISFRTGPLVEGMFEKNPAILPLWEQIISRHRRDYLLCMLRSRLNTISNIDWRSRLEKIRQKTLIIAGSNDLKFIDASHHLAGAIPDSKLVIIEEAGHMVNLEAPEEFNRAVLGFLS